MTGTVVTNVFGNIVETQDTSTNVVSTLVEGIVLSNAQGTVVTLPVTSTVLIERDKASVLVTGIMGPQGVPGISEDDMAYSKRIDFVSETVLYKGEAVVGSSEASGVWRIRKITIAGDNDVTEVWASGTANFDKVWADRASLSYS